METCHEKLKIRVFRVSHLESPSTPPPKQSDGASDASGTTPVEKLHGIVTHIIVYMSAGDSADKFTRLACPLCRSVKSVGSFALCNRYSTHIGPKCEVVCPILAVSTTFTTHLYLLICTMGGGYVHPPRV